MRSKLAAHEIKMSDNLRRPIPQRERKWAKAISDKLVSLHIKPNWISAAGIGFAAISGVFLWLSGFSFGFLRTICLFFAGLGILFRLLCNMFDGMVAVEGGMGEKDGPLWNEVPDRIADVLILAGAGLGLEAANVGAAELGWTCAVLAMLTAYIREIGTRLGMAADFSGPFAKPQRMWVIGAACVIGMFEGMWSGNMIAMHIGIWVVCLGTGFTIFRRLKHVRDFLMAPTSTNGGDI